MFGDVNVGSEDFRYTTGVMKGQNVQVLDIPYDSQTVLTLVVPEDREGLKKVFENCSDANQVSAAIDQVLSLETKRKSAINLFLPKFKMEKDLPLDSVLQDLGMNDIYNPSKSDLSGINGLRDLYVSSAKHKAIVEVNEEGTTAAAVTGILLKTESFCLPTEVRADHPFLFFIRGCSSTGNDKVTVFSGLYAKVPEKKQ